MDALELPIRDPGNPGLKAGGDPAIARPHLWGPEACRLPIQGPTHRLIRLAAEDHAALPETHEKAFIVFRLDGFSRNLRNEVTRNGKVYFHDLGVRNVALGDFRSFVARQDQGALWENFLIAERRKRQLPGVENRFWRLSSGAEVDYVEIEGENLRAFEFKLSAKARAKAPASWVEAYPGAGWQKIDRDNYMPFITG